MSDLRQAIDQYLTLRRRLGYALGGVGSGLRSFASFAAREGATRVTIDLALRWATQSRGTAPATHSGRLQMVRGFAQWRHVTDPRTEVPPTDLLPTRFPRKPPYLYRDTELHRLLNATRNLPSANGLRGRTYFTLFGLLMVTGMRVGEAVALDEPDVNREEAILTIRRTKFGKSRLVPVHASTAAVLAAYAKARDRVHPWRDSAAFFVDERGRRVSQWMVGYTFVTVSSQIGLRPPIHGHTYGHGPRLHDLRHRFAARTLIDWYRAGVDVEHALPQLATYLGHVHVNETYWYLEAVPELLALATKRLHAGRRVVKP